MKIKTMRCSMCGHIFNPSDHQACQNCPLKKGCSLVCCPHCGYEMVDLEQSKWVSWITHWFLRPAEEPGLSELTLADVRSGQAARVAGFSARISGERRAHLQAYGLVPGRDIRVLQHLPVTVVQVEHTELALENELAQYVLVENLRG